MLHSHSTPNKLSNVSLPSLASSLSLYSLKTLTHTHSRASQLSQKNLPTFSLIDNSWFTLSKSQIAFHRTLSLTTHSSLTRTLSHFSEESLITLKTLAHKNSEGEKKQKKLSFSLTKPSVSIFQTQILSSFPHRFTFSSIIFLHHLSPFATLHPPLPPTTHSPSPSKPSTTAVHLPRQPSISHKKPFFNPHTNPSSNPRSPSHKPSTPVAVTLSTIPSPWKPPTTAFTADKTHSTVTHSCSSMEATHGWFIEAERPFFIDPEFDSVRLGSWFVVPSSGSWPSTQTAPSFEESRFGNNFKFLPIYRCCVLLWQSHFLFHDEIVGLKLICWLRLCCLWSSQSLLCVCWVANLIWMYD